MGKILHDIKPCEFGKGMFLTHRSYFLIAKLSFSWWKNIVLIFTRFYLRKTSQEFWSSVFTKIKKCEVYLRKENQAIVSMFESFHSWHTRTSLYLTLAWFEKHCSKVFFSSLFQVIEWLSELRIYFLLCQEQPVQTGILTVWENLAILGRT